MSAVSDALQRAGKYVLTDHATERIRQRVGITSAEAAVAWVKAEVSKASGTKRDGNKTHYITDAFEIVCDGVKVVTVKPADSTNEYLTKFNEVIAKESRKLIAKYERELRKAEISVAEAQLNFLRAKNPNTKAVISERLTDAADKKARIEDEIKAVRYAGKRYGVEV